MSLSKITPFVISLIGIMLSQFAENVEHLGFCTIREEAALGKYWDCFFGNYSDWHSWGWILLTMSISLLIVSPFLFFVRVSVVKTWSLFAAGWLVLSTILIYLASQVHSSGQIPSYDTWIDADHIALYMSVLFSFISLVIILVKSLALRKTRT